jgi:ubiquinone biosynthesis protein Coq4
MLKWIIIIFICISIYAKSQTVNFPKHLAQTVIANLKGKDSVTYYQCHVDTASQKTTLPNGQQIYSAKKKITVTEKFIITKKDSIYICRYSISDVTNYPNKKFPYLTLKEVETWNFGNNQQKQLSNKEVLLLAALESKTHDIVHYELNINKSCPNEIIIAYQKNKSQYIVEGNYLISELLKF